MWTVELLVMLLMVAVNSVFAGYEIALTSISVVRLQTLVQEQRHGARAALRMKEKIESSLAVVQLGVTLVGAIAAATGGAGAEAAIEPALRAAGLSASVAAVVAIATIVVPLTVVTIVLGELVPKVFALRNKEWVCLRLSPLMQWFGYSVWPAVWLFERSVTLIIRFGESCWPGGRKHRPQDDTALQELRALAALARTSRLIGVREERIIDHAARLSSSPVASIVLPAEYINMLYAEDSIQDGLLAAHHDMHTRFPVTERRGDPQAIVGYVNFKDIVSALRLNPDVRSLRALNRTLPSLQATLTIAACLERMIHEHAHIALVRDATRRVVGMITLEDIMEELVGDITDEFDRLPTQIAAAGAAWVVGGGVTLAGLRQQAGVELPAEGGLTPQATLSEWVTQRLGRPVKGGDLVAAGSLRVLVRKVRRNLVMEAHVRPAGAGELEAAQPGNGS